MSEPCAGGGGIWRIPEAEGRKGMVLEIFGGLCRGDIPGCRGVGRWGCQDQSSRNSGCRSHGNRERLSVQEPITPEAGGALSPCRGQQEGACGEPLVPAPP